MFDKSGFSELPQDKTYARAKPPQFVGIFRVKFIMFAMEKSSIPGFAQFSGGILNSGRTSENIIYERCKKVHLTQWP